MKLLQFSPKVSFLFSSPSSSIFSSLLSSPILDVFVLLVSSHRRGILYESRFRSHFQFMRKRGDLSQSWSTGKEKRRFGKKSLNERKTVATVNIPEPPGVQDNSSIISYCFKFATSCAPAL